ncbi:MAG: bifunctional phosphoribosylaminoimidazolecarboxamide formyltransferase/IMP cyclohydrolase [Oligoflexia bacterium]|nr:bifunctional phosphoribosylaminoimidazolecarboxamide formyltransferase/IMP cyclohydrolase [Oligoflexia bacterium]
MFKRAIVSVSDKTGLIEFIEPIAKAGCEIVSTGGTAKFLRENKIKVTEVAEVTGFPEMMDGRVRTLHPKIHMGLLARAHHDDDAKTLASYGVTPFDLVVVNLYPFEQSVQKGLHGAELIEQIDIGGPSMLRSAAKSFERVTVVCHPHDYPEVLKRAKDGTLDYKFKQRLASQVFSFCSYYDSLISHTLREGPWEEESYISFGYKRQENLRYGENPHQKAAWYKSPLKSTVSLTSANQIQGKELSYNNILDLEAAIGAVMDFSKSASVIVKHNSPCGIAVCTTIESAYKKSFDADSVSAFGGIVALNRELSEELARELVGPFLECVVAPKVSQAAAQVLSKKKNLRVLELAGLGQAPSSSQLEIKSIRGGALIQDSDTPSEFDKSWKVIGPHPDAAVLEDLIFSQKAVRHVKSNAIVLARNLQTLGICGGQTNRVDSVKMSIERAKGKSSSFVLASDAFFPFRDSVDLAAQAGVKWIIQPGGSLRDAEVEQAVIEHGLTMVLTGKRHFRH